MKKSLRATMCGLAALTFGACAGTIPQSNYAYSGDPMEGPFPVYQAGQCTCSAPAGTTANRGQDINGDPFQTPGPGATLAQCAAEHCAALEASNGKYGGPFNEYL